MDFSQPSCPAKPSGCPRVKPHRGPGLLLCEGKEKPNLPALEGGRVLAEGLPVARDHRAASGPEPFMWPWQRPTSRERKERRKEEGTRAGGRVD